jgi:hypothetical protein
MEAKLTNAQLAVMAEAFDAHYKGVENGDHYYEVNGVRMTTPRFVELFHKSNPQITVTDGRLKHWFRNRARSKGNVARASSHSRDAGAIKTLAAKELRRRLRTMPIRDLAKLVNGKGGLS